MAEKLDIAVVAGTRPEAIKMAQVYKALKNSDTLNPVFVSTAQHRQMLDQALSIFGIKPDIDMNLMRDSQTLNSLTARILSAWEEYFKTFHPAAILVQGDTTTVFATAVAAFYERIPIGHVEAGLRTHNMYSPYPEEMNRRLTDPISRWCFAPTKESYNNLIAEGTNPSNCFITGNTVIDSLLWMRKKLSKDNVCAQTISDKCSIPKAFCKEFLEGGNPWILVTGHRRENFGKGFEEICRAIKMIVKDNPDTGVLYPVHLNPNVQEPVNRILKDLDRVALIPPVGYEEFIWLMDRCKFVLSDSGGVQEEAPSLGKPVLVMRDTTERPEGVSAGTCTLVGTNAEKIVSEAAKLLLDSEEYARRSALKNPYGDGTASEKIKRILEESLA